MFILDKTNSIANQFLLELREKSIQTDRLRFRKNLERLGEIMAYELSKSLEYFTEEVETPLGTAKVEIIKSQPVLVGVLRAALPFYQGFLNFFDQADSGFIGAYRKEDYANVNNGNIEIDYLYQAAPKLDNREVILIDPMLASGKSFVKTIENLLLHGTPSQIHIVSIIAAPEGLEYIKSQINLPCKIWLGSLDERLNGKLYIIPGLGDAGDLCYGTKL